jgi:two-component system sensor histidine kinase KdpD
MLLLGADASTAGIVYLVVVVWFATLVGTGPSLYLAMLSALSFDYFFLPPRFKLTIASAQDVVAMVSFVVACVVTGRVAERARRQTRQAERRREDVERLYSLSQEMMLHEDAAGLVREIPRLVERNFSLGAVVLYVRSDDQLYSSVPGSSSGPEGLPASAEAQSNSENLRRIFRMGTTSPDQGLMLPEGYVPIDLVFGMNSVGTLACKPATLSREVSTLIAAQVAIAMTRAHAIETTARLEAARSADRLRSALIDSLTHELRTPLTAIRAAATTLVDGQELDEETRTELAAIVDEESFRLDALIGEAMEIAEIESDGIRVKPEPMLPGSFLEQALEESHGLLAHHRVSIDVLEPETPVWFDPHLIGRVLRHLLENAGRYTPANSRIVLSSRRAPGRIEFAVEDDGPGIDVYDLPLIFEKFYRGRQRVTNAKGSGMGLAIARAILAAHGGGIEAESTPGKGTTFRLWVPLVEKGDAGVAHGADEVAI